ncbi:hypothetical protein BGX33_002380 [Mortierella sp. NVP41]|nr:hypothetical protein BGX33_002380 [Mortierella sp. NVP41]
MQIFVVLPSIQDLQSHLPDRNCDNIIDLVRAGSIHKALDPILRAFYSSRAHKKNSWELRNSKKAEVALAVNAVVKMASSTGAGLILLCLGNGVFRTGINLSSMHESLTLAVA